MRCAAGPEEILRQADFVSLHMPLTPETRGCIGKRELGMMKPSAYLINTAREELVERTALLTALESGAIAGAGIDFCADEPAMPYLEALIATGRVLVTPHSGSMTVDAMRRMALHAAQGVPGVQVGVILLRHAAVSFLYIVLRGAFV